MTVDIPRSFFRMAAIAIIAAGVLMTAGFIIHPAGEDATFGTNPMWVPAHALLWMAFVIALPGWFGVYLAQASRAGRFGVASFIVIILGTALTSWIFSSDVTFVPVIARESPALFKQIFSAAHTAIGLASVLTWVLGSVLFGISILRAKEFPSWTGLLLIVGTVIIPIAYLAGWTVRVVALGGGIAALGQAGLGYELLRRAKPTASN
jgi:hypothetical protein